MRRLLIIFFLTIGGQCFGSTFQTDTIDNWQIYNGKDLLLSGHAGGEFRVTIKKKKIKDIEIQFNHCTKHNEDYYASIEMKDEHGDASIMSVYSLKPGQRITLSKSDLLMWTGKVVKIIYSEETTPTPIKMTLGYIKIE